MAIVFLRRARYLIDIAVGLWGTHPRSCPACGHQGRFRAHGLPPRFDARCPRCNSLERHRLFVLADQRSKLIRDGGAVLHVAPEPILRDYLRRRSASYKTLDLHQQADIRAPLEQTDLPDASFDHVVCCHVLEHVDDRRALAEMFRILRPGGSLLAMVPIVEGWSQTYEDSGVRTKTERTLHFGQADHVRYYGRDLRDRMRAAGFSLEEVTAEGDDVVRHALTRGEKLFVATKASK